MRDTRCKNVIKLRQCFTFERQYFIVETFKNLEPYFPSILRVEMTNESSKTKLPTYLKVLREVTGEDNYETWQMAKVEYQMPEADVQAIKEILNAPERK